MKIYQLSDGTWCTRPIRLAKDTKNPCLQDKHKWKTKGYKTPIHDDINDCPKNMNFMSLQECEKCEYQRFLLTEK